MKGKGKGEGKERPDFSQAIVELRKVCHNISQFRLALELGVTSNTVARWEAGDREPDESGYISLWEFSEIRDRKLANWFEGRLKKESSKRLVSRSRMTSQDIAKESVRLEQAENLVDITARVTDNPVAEKKPTIEKVEAHADGRTRPGEIRRSKHASVKRIDDGKS
jgi:transcriptional regulator with XRE-family HTH domain